MGKSAPPFLYDPPPKLGVNSPVPSFNPKAVTQASWAPRPVKPKKNGPLIDFNKHPDSYGVIPPGNKHLGNISPNIKRNVKYARITQLILRINTLLAALGVLFCVIVIRDTTLHIAWMIRVGPGVSILHTLYAIYHLGRSAVSRPPGSTTSYMLFASVLDAGLIPFFVFTSIISKVEYESKAYGWDTLFGEKDVTRTIFFATFLATTVAGGLHLISLIIDIYLAVVFRKITKLPPDMNPLEDNLTSRRHKHTKSEIAEKHLSTSTFDSVPYPDSPVRSIPFMHTRNDSNVSTPSQLGRGDRTSYHSAQSNRFSRSDLPSQQFRQFEQTTVPKTPITRHAAKRRGTGPSRPQSAIFQTPPTSMHSRPGSSAGQTRELSGVSALSDDNWEVYPSNPASPELRAREVSPLRSRSPSPDITDENLKRMDYGDSYDDNALNRGSGTVRRHRGVYTAVEDDEDDDRNDYMATYADNLPQVGGDLGDRYYAGIKENDNTFPGSNLPYNPLGMNPPTPKPLEFERNNQPRTASSNIQNPSIQSDRSTPISGTPNGKKHRSYGELVQNTPSPSRHYENPIENESSALFGGTNSKAKSSTSSSRWRRKSGKPSVYEALQAEVGDSDNDEPDYKSAESDRKGRVVSNTGADINLDLGGYGSPGYGNYLAGLGVGRRRDVSGKVAEEGRGGDLVHEDDGTPSKSKGRRLSKTGEIKAAGWARWKGL
ncbi:hypothetical protein FQN57_005118 [Myotisia sp. PD_48]|nr:hypothetical protein FQN57_005118 [Myotisia sp. PD_48]